MARDWLPTLAMVAVQFGFAGLNILSKLAMDSGMSAYVMIAYRQIVASVFLTPIAYFLERFEVPTFIIISFSWFLLNLKDDFSF